MGAVGVGRMVFAFAARHLMALDTFFVIMMLWAVPCTGFETTGFTTMMRTSVFKRRKKCLPTRDVRQETKHDGST